MDMRDQQSINARISEGVNKHYASSGKSRKRIEDRVCLYCGFVFQVTGRQLAAKKYCSASCASYSNAKKISSPRGGGVYRPSSLYSRNSGWYKGYKYDSSWELAWIIYSLDHGIKFDRNTESFEYTHDDKTHKFYPDFILPDGSYVEIKGRDLKIESKLKYFPHKITVLRRSDLNHIFKYVESKYGKKWDRRLK